MSLKENLGHEHWRKDCASKEIETSDAGAASELLGVTRQSISRWEQNQAYPEMEKILRLSDILGVSCDYFEGKCDKKGLRYCRQRKNVYANTTT